MCCNHSHEDGLAFGIDSFTLYGDFLNLSLTILFSFVLFLLNRKQLVGQRIDGDDMRERVARHSHAPLVRVRAELAVLAGVGEPEQERGVVGPASTVSGCFRADRHRRRPSLRDDDGRAWCHCCVVVRVGVCSLSYLRSGKTTSGFPLHCKSHTVSQAYYALHETSH